MQTRVTAVVALGLVTLLTACGGGSSPRGGNGDENGPADGGSGGATFGLDARPANATCVAPEKTRPAGQPIMLEPAFTNLSLLAPIAMLQAPGDASRWFVVERRGRVKVFSAEASVAAATDFIDLTARIDTRGEGGLLGMAFDPDYARNGRVFLSWTETGAPLVSVIARFTATADGAALDPSTESPVLRLDQDFTNHDGGNIAFGPDGFLYAGFGDGGSGGDPNGRAQDTTNLLGALLRLDVAGAQGYAIPADNPFAGNAECPANPNAAADDCPEIYAWGLRNPWRFSFDRATGALWAGDVGQGAWEEVDRVERGGNYGWDCREGTHEYADAAPSCSTATGLIDPVYEYAHSEGIAVTGGYVYRGAALPGLVGSYVFGDYGSGRIWRLVADGAGGYTAEELLDTNLSIASFAEGNDGELYVLDIAGGGVYAMVPAPGNAPSASSVPALLSATGCVSPDDPTQPAAGLIPYDVAAPFWSDGAQKARWLAIPDGTSITVGPDGDFAFPEGTVLLKHFRLDGALVETRLFMRHPGGEWSGYSYEWNAEQTDAALVEGGETADVGSRRWIFPSGDDCLVCHTAAAGYSLGLETAQLNRDFAYASTGRSANQLATLDAIGLFDSPLGDPGARFALPDPADAGRSLEARARAYLHVNCSGCHRPQGPTPTALDLRFSTGLADTAACGVTPQAGDLGLGPEARIVAPGAPEQSVLLARMGRRDANGMPPLASAEIDADGVALVGDWIASLSGCP